MPLQIYNLFLAFTSINLLFFLSPIQEEFSKALQIFAKHETIKMGRNVCLKSVDREPANIGLDIAQLVERRHNNLEVIGSSHFFLCSTPNRLKLTLSVSLVVYNSGLNTFNLSVTFS